TRDRVGVVQHQRLAARDTHQRAGKRREAAEAQHQVRAPTTNDAKALEARGEQRVRSEEQRAQTLAADAAERYRLEVDAVRGHQARLHPFAGSEPEDARATREELGGDREAGENVPARAAGGDHHRRRHTAKPRRRRRFSQSMRSRSAIATQFATMPLPPKDRSGSVSPFVGRTPMLTPMLMNVCTPIHTPMPHATSAANARSRRAACRPIAYARYSSQPNSTITAVTPMKPSSSAITASRKSVCASGRYRSFSTLEPSPTPSHSPRPNAMSECDSW